MANDAIKISQLGIVTTLSSNDRVVVLTNPASSAQTQTISLANFANSLVANAFPIANSTQLGVIKVGSGLSIAANGVLTAPMPVANTSSYGVIKVGNNLSINATGYLSAGFSNGESISVNNFTITGTMTANSSNGAAGYVLTSNGTVPYWSATANNTSFVGTVSAANVVSNNQLSSNLANYQTTAGLSANIAAYLPTYTGIVNSASYTVGSNFIANSTVLTFAPNTFNLGSVSKTANGYVWLPNGVLCQWGTVLANTTTGNATFSIAFPTACQSVNFSVIGSANVAYQFAAPNTTVATIRTSSSTTAISVQYKAIGY